MALPVDATIQYRTVDIPTGQNFTWSLSKTLDQLTTEEVKSQDAFTGFNSFAVNQLAEGVLSNGAPVNNPNHACVWTTNGNSWAAGGVAESWQSAHWSTPANFPAGVYMRTVLVAAPDATAVNTSLTNTINNIRIVVDVTAGSDTDLQHLIYNGRTVVCKYGSEFQYSEDRLVGLSHKIFPSVLLLVDDTLFLWIYGGLRWDVWRTAAGANPIDQGYRSSTAYINYNNESFHRLGFGWTLAKPVSDSVVTGITWDSQSQQTGDGHYDNVDFNGHTGRLKMIFGASNGAKIFTPELVDNADKTITKMYLAFAGFKFVVDGVTYKPIVTDGLVTGYTDDMSVTSEWDTWTTAQGHNVPVTPPGPTPPGPGYDDDPWSGVSFSGVGLGGGGAFARCYYMTSTELANLRSWMCGINVPEGFNPMAQIIGLSQVPVALSGDAPETVQFINSSAVYDPGVTSRVVDSNVSTQYSMGSPIKYSLGSVDIVRRMQERGEPYLDYSCQIELYLPLIGVFSLDTQAVMGRTLEAEAILDPISGTLAAYAWVSKDGQKLPVAYGSTTISVDLPITAQQYSVSKAALKQANSQLGTSLLSSVATLVAAAVGGSKGESSNARVSGGASSMQGTRGMNSYAQASSIAASQAAISQTGNVVGDFMQWGRTIKQLQYGNNTAISGSFGGSVAQWSYPFNAYVKINRPRYEKPSNYAHSQGVPCVQTKRIGDCTGLIQCIGVDVINIEGATDLERQAIQAALSSGIYAGGGGE